MTSSSRVPAHGSARGSLPWPWRSIPTPPSRSRRPALITARRCERANVSAGLATQGVAVGRAAWLEWLRHKPVWLGVLGVVALVAVAAAGVMLGTVPVAPADTIAILGHRLLGVPQTVTWPASAE